MEPLRQIESAGKYSDKDVPALAAEVRSLRAALEGEKRRLSIAQGSFDKVHADAVSRGDAAVIERDRLRELLRRMVALLETGQLRLLTDPDPQKVTGEWDALESEARKKLGQGGA